MFVEEASTSQEEARDMAVRIEGPAGGTRAKLVFNIHFDHISYLLIQLYVLINSFLMYWCND